MKFYNLRHRETPFLTAPRIYARSVKVNKTSPKKTATKSYQANAINRGKKQATVSESRF